ncbi:MAG: hypothetical protein ABI340_07210 [Nitrososphaera sp.]|jgi:hypothetical protein
MSCFVYQRPNSAGLIPPGFIPSIEYATILEIATQKYLIVLQPLKDFKHNTR